MAARGPVQLANAMTSSGYLCVCDVVGRTIDRSNCFSLAFLASAWALVLASGQGQLPAGAGLGHGETVEEEKEEEEEEGVGSRLGF